MTRTAARLAELDAISRERSLTDTEQAEVVRLARVQRDCETRKRRYASEPDYRAKMLGRARARKFRYATDPDYRQRQIERVRAYRESRA